ncbi:MAG: exo-alpha-sialidase [Bacteroidota bacterium]|nr:exo-alpha-sialidase [Bacteroidota bacterium]
MRKIYLAFLIFIYHNLSAQNDIQINPNQSFCGESNLAVNPTNGNMVVAWMKLTAVTPIPIISMAVSNSTDGGKTWSNPVYMPHYFKTGTSADPTMAYNSSGELFLVYIDSKLAKDSGGVYISKSSDDGKNWAAPNKLIDFNDGPDIPIDRPFIAIDKSNNIHKGRIYVTSKSYKDGQKPHHIWYTFSDNKGKTWNPPAVLDTLCIPIDPNSSTACYPAINSTGKFMVMYFSYNTKYNIYPRILVAESYDGINFTFNPALNLSAISAIPATDSLLQPSMSFTTNPQDSNNYMICWADNRNNDLDIYSIYTSDGKNWSTPNRVNDDNISNGFHQDMCWSAVSPNGTFGIGWRDRRNNTKNQNSDYVIYCAVSTDKGKTFQSNIKINQISGSLMVPVDGNDFIGLEVSDSMLMSTWADKRNGKNQLYYNSKKYITNTAIANNFDINNGISIYPNPADEVINIYIKDNRSNYIIEITDLLGQQVYKQSTSINLTPISTKSFAAKGAYLVKIFDKKGIEYYSSKIVVQ